MVYRTKQNCHYYCDFKTFPIGFQSRGLAGTVKCLWCDQHKLQLLSKYSLSMFLAFNAAESQIIVYLINEGLST